MEPEQIGKKIEFQNLIKDLFFNLLTTFHCLSVIMSADGIGI
jgi:hypothetical protein